MAFWNCGVQNLPYQEYLRRRNQKLCYHCRGPFVVGHKCTKKNLRLIILAEDEWINEEGEIMRTKVEEEDPHIVAEELEVECQWMDLSMCSIGGFT